MIMSDDKDSRRQGVIRLYNLCYGLCVLDFLIYVCDCVVCACLIITLFYL